MYRYRLETEFSDQASYTANQSSEVVEGELMEHGYIVGRKGTMGLMKLSKVVLRNIYNFLQCLKGIFNLKIIDFLKRGLQNIVICLF